MTEREALKLALEALKVKHSSIYGTSLTARAIKACEEALAQPEQEPVAWMNKHGACMSAVFKNVDATGGEYTIPLYVTPPQRTWVGLTDEQREEIAKGWRGRNWTVGDIIDAIEAALKNKNS